MLLNFESYPFDFDPDHFLSFVQQDCDEVLISVEEASGLEEGPAGCQADVEFFVVEFRVVEVEI